MAWKDLALHAEQVVKTFGCQEKVQICDVVKLAIKTAAGTDLVLSFLVVPSICERITRLPVTLARDTCPHLFGLNLANNRTYSTAIETALGWVLSGPVPGIMCEEVSINLISAHALKLEVSVLQSAMTATWIKG